MLSQDQQQAKEGETVMLQQMIHAIAGVTLKRAREREREVRI